MAVPINSGPFLRLAMGLVLVTGCAGPLRHGEELPDGGGGIRAERGGPEVYAPASPAEERRALVVEHGTAPRGKAAHGHGPDQTPEHLAESATGEPRDRRLEAVAAIHGGAGPWAVAGYRMGEYALRRLGLTRFSFDLEVIHHTPRSVQYSCIADGAAAATGASPGKLNLTLIEADESTVATVYRRRSTGASIILRPTPAFAARFKDVPRAGLAAAGEAVMGLTDDEIFEEVAGP